MNISAGVLSSSDTRSLTQAIRQLKDLLKTDRQAEGPLDKTGAPNVGFVMQESLNRLEEKLKRPNETRDRSQEKLERLQTLRAATTSLEGAFQSTIRTRQTSKTLQATNGIIGSASLGAKTGTHSVNIVQKAENCRFTINPLDANGQNTYWATEGTIITAAALTNSMITASAGVDFTVTTGGVDKGVNLAAGKSLAEVIVQINTDLAGTGITAKSEPYKDGLRLVLVSDDAGSDNVFTVKTNTADAFTNTNPAHDAATASTVRFSPYKAPGDFGWDPNSTIPAGTLYDPNVWPTPSMRINSVTITAPWYDTLDNASVVLPQIVQGINGNLATAGSTVYAELIDNDPAGRLHIEFKNTNHSAGIDIDTNLPHFSNTFIKPEHVRCTSAKSEAIVEYDGSTIISGSNNIDGLVPGLKLDVSNADLGKAKVSVLPGKDWASVVTGLAEAYNNLSQLITQAEEAASNGDNPGITRESSFREARHILGSISRFKTSINGSSKGWGHFGVSFVNDKMTLDAAALREAYKDPNYALKLQTFLAGTADITTYTRADTGNGVINSQFSTLGKGGYVALDAANTWNFADLHKISVAYNGGDRALAASYNVQCYADNHTPIAVNIATNAADPDNIILNISTAAGGLKVDYHCPPTSSFKAGETDEVYLSYTRQGDAIARKSSVSLLSAGKNPIALDAISNIAFYSGAGALDKPAIAIFYNGKIYNIGVDFPAPDNHGTILDQGGGTFEVTVTKAGHDLENLKLKLTVDNMPPVGQTYLFNNTAFGPGIGDGDILGRVEKIAPKLGLTKKTLEREHAKALDTIKKVTDAEEAIRQRKIAEAQVAKMMIEMNDISDMLSAILGV